MKLSRVAVVFITLGIVLISGYIVFSIVVFTNADEDILCKDFHIYFPENEKLLLVTRKDIQLTLNKAGLHPIGEKYKNLKTDKIEIELLKNKLLKSVECFKTPSGDVYLKVVQRTPQYMIAGAECFYVDTEKEIMPVSLNHALYLPVASGNITKSLAKGDLYDFITFVNNNQFWNSQIEQIYVRPDKTVEIVPRVGDVIIYMGSFDNFRGKLKNLEMLYTHAFTHIGWGRYETIDLQYENQIVCRKKTVDKSKT